MPALSKWNSVSAGTTLMPTLLSTMPMTVARCSTSSTVFICSGCSSASRCWRTLLARDMCTKGWLTRSFGRTVFCRASGWSLWHTRWNSSEQSSRVDRSPWPGLLEASARSTLPRRTSSTHWSDRVSVSDSSMPGYMPRNSPKTPGSQPAHSEGSAATATRPLRLPTCSLMLASTSSMSRKSRAADSANSRPSLVNCTLRVSRSNRRVPMPDSSCRISALKAGWDRWHCSAARVKLRNSPRVRKARR